MSTICLYGAASDRIDKEYIKDVEELGKEMARRGHKMIYGAGSSGLMGAAARGMDSKNGHIIGVTPHFMHTFEPIYENPAEEFPLPCFFHALKRYLHRLPPRCWLQRLQKPSKPVSI